MKCKNCGRELSSGAAFCPHCGAQVDMVAAKFDESKEKLKEKSSMASEKIKKLNKKEKILLGVGSGILLAVFIVLISMGIYNNSPNQKIVRAIDACDSFSAISIYNEKIAGNSASNASLANALKDHFNSLKKDFKKDKIDYDEFYKRVSIAKSFNIESLNTELGAIMNDVFALKESKDAFKSANELFDRDEYKQAIYKYRLVISDDDNYDKAQKQIEKSAEKYKEKALELADGYAKNNEYGSAIKELKEVAEIIDDKEIKSKLSEYTDKYSSTIKSEAMSKSDAYAKSGDWVNAVLTLDTAIKDIGDDNELKSKLSEYSAKYVTYIISKSDKLIGERNYSEAISLLNDALKTVPENESLKSKLASVEDSKPVPLSDAVMVNHDGWEWNDGAPIDTFGNDYSEASNYVIPYYNGYGEFRIYKKYKTLSGYIAPFEKKYEESEWYVQIYVDDKLAYTSKNITRKTDKFSFNVNVANAEYVKIVIHRDKYFLYENEGIILSDMMLNK